MSETTLEEARRALRSYGFFDIPSPWTIRAADALEDHNHYAEFAGWKDWVDSFDPVLSEAIDDLDSPSDSLLYAMFVETARFAYEAGRRECPHGAGCEICAALRDRDRALAREEGE